MSPSLTLIVPCKEWTDDTRRCVEALAGQVKAGDELLLVLDGGAAPRTTPAGLRVLRLPRRGGPAVARNAGAAVAKGEVLVFVDSDVIVETTALDRVRAFFAAGRGEAVFGCYDDTPAAPGLVSQFRNLQHHYTHALNAGPAQTFWTGLGAVRRQVFFAMNGLDETYLDPCVEDIELGTRMAKAGHRLVLDACLRGKHLKRWRLLPMWRNDLVCRALPWSRLILATGEMPRGLNTSPSTRLAVAAQGLALLAAAAALLLRQPALALLSVGLAAVALGCQAGFLRFAGRRRGPAFALGCAPLILAYLTLSGLGFAWALLERRGTEKPVPRQNRLAPALQEADIP